MEATPPGVKHELQKGHSQNVFVARLPWNPRVFTRSRSLPSKNDGNSGLASSAKGLLPAFRLATFAWDRRWADSTARRAVALRSAPSEAIGCRVRPHNPRL